MTRRAITSDCGNLCQSQKFYEIKKIFRFPEAKTGLYLLPSRPGQRAIMIATNVDGTRWTRCAETNGMRAYGKDVWS